METKKEWQNALRIHDVNRHTGLPRTGWLLLNDLLSDVEYGNKRICERPKGIKTCGNNDRPNYYAISRTTNAKELVTKVVCCCCFERMCENTMSMGRCAKDEINKWTPESGGDSNWKRIKSIIGRLAHQDEELIVTPYIDTTTTTEDGQTKISSIKWAVYCYIDRLQQIALIENGLKSRFKAQLAGHKYMDQEIPLKGVISRFSTQLVAQNYEDLPIPSKKRKMRRHNKGKVRPIAKDRLMASFHTEHPFEVSVHGGKPFGASLPAKNRCAVSFAAYCRVPPCIPEAPFVTAYLAATSQLESGDLLHPSDL